MSANPVLWNLDDRGVATVTLNRPEVNNAYDGALIQGVLAAMDDLGKKPNLRVVVLKGNGKHLVDLINPDELKVLTQMLRKVLKVRFITFGSNHILNAGTLRSECFLFEATDR